MSLYTIITATNRPDNRTSVFAETTKKILNKKELKVEMFSLLDIPQHFSLQEMYSFEKSPLLPIVEKFIKPADKFIFLVPEYNGSYPGVLKVFIDAVQPSYFKGKKALLIGTSSGRAGNLRGMDHLTGVLHYLKVEVFSQKLPISSIDDMVKGENGITDSATIQLLDKLIEDYNRF